MDSEEAFAEHRAFIDEFASSIDPQVTDHRPKLIVNWTESESEA
jgi:hypothetical protein